METIWRRLRALEGRTLRTAGYGLPFVITQVTEAHLVVEPEIAGPRRLISRAAVESAARLRLRLVALPAWESGEETTETTPSYVIAIRRALEEPLP